MIGLGRRPPEPPARRGHAVTEVCKRFSTAHLRAPFDAASCWFRGKVSQASLACTVSKDVWQPTGSGDTAE
jgi:hypothetical protein